MPVDEQSRFPEDPDLKRRVGQMAKQFGSDCLRRPDVGCGSKFYPEKKGASTVVEIRMAVGAWEAFSSARIPHKLDNAIKAHFAKFYNAAQYLAAEDAFNGIQMLLRMLATSKTASSSLSTRWASGSTRGSSTSPPKAGAAWP